MQILDFFKNKKLDERLNCAVDSLIGQFHPQKIYIFGSFSRDFSKKDMDIDLNDIDLLVIVKETDLRFTERIVAMKRICTGEPHISPLMYTEKEIEEMLEEGEGFLEDVLDEGVLIYEDLSQA